MKIKTKFIVLLGLLLSIFYIQFSKLLCVFFLKIIALSFLISFIQSSWKWLKKSVVFLGGKFVVFLGEYWLLAAITYRMRIKTFSMANLSNTHEADVHTKHVITNYNQQANKSKKKNGLSPCVPNMTYWILIYGMCTKIWQLKFNLTLFRFHMRSTGNINYINFIYE